MASNYNIKDIKTLDGIDAIRLRSGNENYFTDFAPVLVWNE